jgi:hypothetical protein
MAVQSVMRGEVRRWSYGEAAVLFCGGMAIVVRTVLGDSSLRLGMTDRLRAMRGSPGIVRRGGASDTSV